MESGPNRVNAPLEGPVIPRSRRDLFKDQSFGDEVFGFEEGDNANTLVVTSRLVPVATCTVQPLMY